MSTQEMTAQLEQLAMKALDRPYSSFSATDDSETGNRYQAVGLGDRTTRGLREDRSRFLDVLDLRGRTVLDLGSNLGEISRAARARGAALVDGFEIDPYFNEVAHLANVLTGTTRVSFYERDMADPSSYDASYDVVLAFSAFRFIADCLDRLAGITDILVVETHELKGNFDERYLDPLTKHFPVYRMLGESDAERQRVVGARAVGVFARNHGALLDALAPELRSGEFTAGVLAAGVRSRHLRGAVEEVEFSRGRMQVSGWCRDPATSADAVELATSAEGPGGASFGTLAVTEPTSEGRFEFECEAPLDDTALVRLQLSAFAGPAALGTMSAYWSPALAEGAPLVGLTVAHDLLEPLGRYRALDSIETALHLDSGRAPLEQFLPALLPNAELRSVSAREMPVPHGDGSFDLVMGHGTPRAEEAWVSELHRVTRPGAYLSLSVLGELARRFGQPGIRRQDLIALCVPRFDVITYVEGGVAGLHDLMVLRRP